MSIIDHNVEAVEVFVSYSINNNMPHILQAPLSLVQDNSGALLQDEEYIITEDLRSGINLLYLNVFSCQSTCFLTQ